MLVAWAGETWKVGLLVYFQARTVVFQKSTLAVPH